MLFPGNPEFISEQIEGSNIFLDLQEGPGSAAIWDKAAQTMAVTE